MDSGKSTETEDQTIQPVDVVVTDTEETKVKPQTEETEGLELYVEEENGDQQKPKGTMTQAQAYAAFQKEKQKRKDKQEQIDKDAIEKQELRDKLKALEKTVGNITRGEMPDFYDYEDKHKYYEALKAWESSGVEQKQETKQQNQASPADEQTEFYLYQKEQEISKVLPDYENIKAEALKVFQQSNLSPDQSLSYLSGIAAQKGVDIAKVVVAIKTNPKIVQDLLNAGANQFLIGDILESAANKVKTRSKKSIDTKPEPSINNSGPVNSFSAEVEAARDAWVKNPNVANHAKYKRAKDKAKAGQQKGN